MGTILQSLAPLAALYLLNMILKTMGLGNLTKLSGSVGMATQAAVAASGDKNWRNQAGKAFDKAGGMVGGKSSFGNTTKADLRAEKRKEIRRKALGEAAKAGIGARVAGKGRAAALDSEEPNHR